MSKIYRILLVSLMVALMLSACGGDGEEENAKTDTPAPETGSVQPTATAVVEPSPTQPPEPAADEPTQAPSDEEPAAEEPTQAPSGESLDLGAVRTNPMALSEESPLQSYRLRVQWSIEPKEEGGETPATAMTIEAAHTSDPPAEEMSFSYDQMGVQSKIIHIGDQVWLQSGGQWIEISSDELASSFDQMLTALDSATANLAGDAKLVGKENLGVDTLHYTFDESLLGATLGVYSKIEGDVWVAEEGNYVVKYVFTAEDNDATYHWDWEVYDINTPITIEPPADAQSARDDVPLMPDATDRFASGAMVTYQTPSELTAVIDFYQEQMPAQGWVQAENSVVSDQFAMLRFSKDGETLSITIAPDDAGGTAVIIQPEQ